jgi:hypothetical protein
MPSRFTRRYMRLALVVSASVGLASQALAETIVALRDGNELVTFDSATPATTAATAVTGLMPGETLVGIDFRPANGALYGITDQGRIYTIAVSGAATLASTSSVVPAGTAFGVDFNPVADRMRVVSDTDQNLRIDVTTGTAITDTSLLFAPADPNAAANPNAAAAGYTNSAAGVVTTTLYVIDPGTDVLATQNPPNNGTLNTVGGLGVDATASAGLDISRAGNTAYAALTVGATTGLYRIDLATGAASSLGTIGSGAGVRGLAVAPPPAPEEADVYGVTDANVLVRFSTLNPALLTTIAPVTGLQESETIVGIDFRPADLVLYGLGSTSRLYTIDTDTGVATEVAELSAGVAGASFGVDFNPVADRMRVVSEVDENLRINPADAVVTVDVNLTYVAADPHAGEGPTVVAAGYTNNFLGAATTSLYVIDAGFDTLAFQDPPNNGTLGTIGALGFDSGTRSALDIVGSENSAFAALTPDAGATNFCSVDLDTGQATLIGPVGNAVALRAMAVLPARVLDADHMVLHFNFKKPGKDKFMVSGQLPALEGPPDGVVVTVDIGGATQTFTLDRKGRAREGDDTFALIGKPKNGRVKFQVQLKKGDFSDEMTDEGMDGTEDAKKETRTIVMRVEVGEIVYEDSIDVNYTAKTGKTGIAKFGPEEGNDAD